MWLGLGGRGGVSNCSVCVCVYACMCVCVEGKDGREINRARNLQLKQKPLNLHFAFIIP